jgi:citrate lyase subunit beta/citryl-CoA lyase
LPRLTSHRALLLPRVNGLRTPWFHDDVAALAVPGVFGISVGKVDSARDIEAIHEALSAAEHRAGLEIGQLRLVPWIESAKAIVNCHSICTASERIVAVAFGGEDYAHDMHIERLDDESNVLYARSAICNAAHAAGVLALDTPYFRFRDAAGLKASSIAARRLGFQGRFAIHPDQIATINSCFAPNPEEIEQARRIVAAFAEAERQGRGSTSLDGRVIDVPVVRRARALLAQAGAAPERVP